MNRPYPDRTAKWLVGDELATVLQLSDDSLAHQLADQGHEVVVATTGPIDRRHAEVEYVELSPGSFPFVADAFTVVVTDGPQSQTSLAEIARILAPGGLVSSIVRGYDENIPWLRKLREIVGGELRRPPSPDTLGASGLFAEAEVSDFADWEQLGLDGLMQLARLEVEVADVERAMRQAHELFTSYGADYQPLRLRRHTRCSRSRVLKESMPAVPATPDATLFDFR